VGKEGVAPGTPPAPPIDFIDDWKILAVRADDSHMKIGSSIEKAD
jgi:hypothetical protein